MLRDVLKEIVPDQEARIMSIAAEEWKAEGIQIGQAMGKAEGKAECCYASCGGASTRCPRPYEEGTRRLRGSVERVGR